MPPETYEAARAQWRPAILEYNEGAASDMVALGIRPERWIPHRAGQHYELRFPGEELSRSFSVVSSTHATGLLELGVQILPTGLLSPRLAKSEPGQAFKIRGPLGEAFTWTPEHCGPIVLLGAGAGITPLLSIFDSAAACPKQRTVCFLVSATSPERIYRFERYRNALITRFTAIEPRIDQEFLEEALAPVFPDPEAGVWVCGPPGFIDSVVDDIIELGVPESRIRSESFL